jgi:hypothetical protein
MPPASRPSRQPILSRLLSRRSLPADFCAGYGERSREFFLAASAVLVRSGRTRTRSRRGSIPQDRWRRTGEQVQTAPVRLAALRLAFRRSGAGVALPWCPRFLLCHAETVCSLGARYRKQRMISNDVPGLRPPVSVRVASKGKRLQRRFPSDRRAVAGSAIRFRNHQQPPRLTPLGDSAPGLI